MAMNASASCGPTRNSSDSRDRVKAAAPERRCRGIASRRRVRVRGRSGHGSDERWLLPVVLGRSFIRQWRLIISPVRLASLLCATQKRIVDSLIHRSI